MRNGFKLKPYRDIDIYCGHTGSFWHDGSLESFNNYLLCQIDIDRMIERQQANDNVPLSLEVVRQDGKVDTIVGIHAGYGWLKFASRDRVNGYPVAALPYLKRVATLREELNRMSALIAPLRIDGDGSPGITAESLMRTYEEKCALAAKLPPLEGA